MVEIVLQSILAAQAGGRNRFAVEADTVAEALHSLPVSDLLFDELGRLRRHLNVYLDGTDIRERGGLSCRLSDARELRVVAMVSGG